MTWLVGDQQTYCTDQSTMAYNKVIYIRIIPAQNLIRGRRFSYEINHSL